MKRAQETLITASRTIAEAGSRQGAAEPASNAPKEGDVVDAEFVEVDDSKR